MSTSVKGIRNLSAVFNAILAMVVILPSSSPSRTTFRLSLCRIVRVPQISRVVFNYYHLFAEATNDAGSRITQSPKDGRRLLIPNPRRDYSVAAFASLSGYELQKIRPAFMLNATRSSSKNSRDDEKYDFDLMVIGAGSGGIASARRAASYGAKVGVAEMGRLGGTCVNVGCVPKKVMWNAALISDSLQGMHHYGFSGYENTNFDWSYIKKSRDSYIERLNDVYNMNMISSGINRFIGEASLINNCDRDGISVDVMVTSVDNGHSNKTQQRYSSKHIIIATGGYPSMPSGSDDSVSKYSISSDGFFELESLPRKAVVVGAGYIAVELAGVLNALGTETYLAVRKEKALRQFDELLSSTLDEEMERHGITILRNTEGVGKILLDDVSGLKTVLLNNGEVVDSVDVVILAAGRTPAVNSLNLQKIGVLQDERGYIVVNEYSETNVQNVYAVGDVCGNVELTPMAIAAGRRLADRLFGPSIFKNAKVSYENVPTVVFSHPPIGTIGLSEEQALNMYGTDNIKIYRSIFSNLYYGPWRVGSKDVKPKTAMKLVCAGRNELVVGLHVIGMGADEMLQGFGVAMKMGATKADFDSCLAIHPTAAEEFVTMFPWGLGSQESGARTSPVNGAAAPEPMLEK